MNIQRTVHPLWRSVRISALLGVGIALAGCGTYVPEIQDIGTTTAGQLLVQDIVHSVHCEVKNAVIDVIGKKGARPTAMTQEAAFMDDWGAEMTLTLTIDEKSSVSPNAVWMPSIFSFGAGLSGSSDATRTETLNFFYSVDELRNGTPCTDVRSNGPLGSLLIQSDLKLDEWLRDEVMAVGTLEIAAPKNAESILGQNVLSHDVKFDVLTSGNINPSWKLVRATVNQSGSLFAASRERTHNLLITFGPIDTTKKMAV